MSLEEFKKIVTADQPEAPDYFAHDAILNRKERTALHDTMEQSLKPLSVDEVLGVAQSASGQPGMTANLTVDYRSPTPLLRELVFRGWCEKVEGRKIFTRGTLHSGDTLCAESSALFISMRPELFARLLALRDGHS